MNGAQRVTAWSNRAIARIVVGVVAVFLVFVVFVFAVKSAVAEVYVVPTNVVTPEVPPGARILVYKLDGRILPGRIIAYRAANGQTWLGRVDAVDDLSGTVDVSTNVKRMTVKQADVVGRVVLTTR